MKYDNEPFVNDLGYLVVQHQGQERGVHRLVMEEILGRKLEPWEIVHHKDENKLNCEPWNLELTTRPDHTRHHKLGQKLSKETIDKIREGNLAKKEIHRRNNLGKVVSEETREKLRQRYRNLKEVNVSG